MTKYILVVFNTTTIYTLRVSGYTDPINNLFELYIYDISLEPVKTTQVNEISGT